MMGKVQHFLSYLVLKLANAFASRSVRRKVKTWYFSKYCIVDGVADEFHKKYEALALNRNSIETLVVGSSHGDYGFVPDEKSFNLCGTSQDLYLSYELYRRCADMPRLKQVVLFYSVFSPGFETERTSEMDFCLYYMYFWHIPLRYKRGEFAYKMDMIKQYLTAHQVSADSAYRGENSYQNTMPSIIKASDRVESHLKNNRRHNGQTEYVRRMAELAQANGHGLVVVIPPFRSDYTALLPPFDEMFSELLELKKQCPAIKLLSFLGNREFDDQNFCDTDHLDRQGAEKLTAKILGSLAK